jgi:hypothetical protein
LRWWKYGDPTDGGTAHGDPSAFLDAACLTATDDCILWPYSRLPNGYPKVRIGGRNRIVSRVVCERAHGSPPTLSHQAAHSCGNGHEGCINPRHLRWATPIENEADKLSHGTRCRGVRHGAAKLTETDVRDIRRRANAGETQSAIARGYSLNPKTINDIVLRKNWAWLK